MDHLCALQITFSKLSSGKCLYLEVPLAPFQAAKIAAA